MATHHLNANSSYFGFPSDNFIGSLLQTNTPDQNWGTFYAKQRLLPQLQLALKNGLLDKTEIPITERIVTTVNELTTGMLPSLLHGDLWSGIT